jgi:hypothetical protein
MSQIIQLASAAVADRRTPVPERLDPAVRTDTVYVLFTSIDETLAAVRVAGGFAKALGVPVTVIHFRPVSYALPVDAPCGVSPAETDAFITRLRAVGADIRVCVYLCRDEQQAIPFALNRHSLIVIAGRRSWWSGRSEQRRRMLEAAGHFVMSVDASEHLEKTHA